MANGGIGRWKYSGPLFGGSLTSRELSAFYEPFDTHCTSCTGGAYKIPVNSEGINLLTNQKNKFLGSNFDITELEVWGVTFDE